MFCFVSNSRLGSSKGKNNNYFFKVDVTSFKLSMNKGLCNNMSKNNAIYMRAILLSINQSIDQFNQLYASENHYHPRHFCLPCNRTVQVIKWILHYCISRPYSKSKKKKKKHYISNKACTKLSPKCAPKQDKCNVHVCCWFGSTYHNQNTINISDAIHHHTMYFLDL